MYDWIGIDLSISDLVNVIFEVISDYQQLYPDTELSGDSDDEGNTEEEYFTTVEGLQHLSLEGESVLTHLETIIENESATNG